MGSWADLIQRKHMYSTTSYTLLPLCINALKWLELDYKFDNWSQTVYEGRNQVSTRQLFSSCLTMSSQELWTTEAQIDEDLQDLTQSMGTYDQDAVYEPGAQLSQIDETTFVAMQQHMAQQAAFAQIPDVVKRVRPRYWLLIID